MTSVNYQFSLGKNYLKRLVQIENKCMPIKMYYKTKDKTFDINMYLQYLNFTSNELNTIHECYII